MRNDGHDLPLTIGKTVFTGDRRVMIDYSSPDEWNLVIRRAHVQDSGEYLCQVTGDGGNLMEKAFMLIVQEALPESGQLPPKVEQKKSASALDHDSTGTDQSKSLLNDESDSDRMHFPSRRDKNVLIFGRRVVFLGEQFVSLTCTATFRTADAKRNPTAAVEWYHGGQLQVSNASSRDVSMSWKNGDTAVSVLTLYSVRIGHAGEWLCLKRPSERPDGGMETARHRLTVLARELHPDKRSQQQKLQLTQEQMLGSHSNGGHKFTCGASAAGLSALIVFAVICNCCLRAAVLLL
ncbi:hypothetical protein BOX15_Mlig000181g1 [Macrostomum lignano]|nr:hypothetical protein BOX15_Mlig000181g1 [Macrostomum lignano]